MLSALRRYVDDPIATWRTGSPQSQAMTLGALLLGVSLCFVVSVLSYGLMPMTAYYVWLLLGMLLLRFRPLVVLSIVTGAASVTAALLDGPMTTPRITACFTLFLSLALILYASSRQQSGLPGPVSEAMLTDLKTRLQSQGSIPELPDGWHSQSAMIAASGVGYGGDFLVANLHDDGRRLELILVDVCGKGVGAASQALQFGGALGGLIGALPPRELFNAANDVPAAPALRRDLRDGRARAHRPRDRRLPADQRRPSARTHLVAGSRGLGGRQGQGYGARHPAAPGAAHDQRPALPR